jgi:hypothetical protein
MQTIHASSVRGMFLFMVSMMSFVWRSGSTGDQGEKDQLTPKQALVPRMALTSVFLLGMAYFVLILRTLRNYGRRMRADTRC